MQKAVLNNIMTSDMRRLRKQTLTYL